MNLLGIIAAYRDQHQVITDDPQQVLGPYPNPARPGTPPIGTRPTPCSPRAASRPSTRLLVRGSPTRSAHRSPPTSTAPCPTASAATSPPPSPPGPDRPGSATPANPTNTP